MERHIMSTIENENADTRYFVEIDLASLKIIRCGFDQKQILAKGQQTKADIHRLFITKGQYQKFINRCPRELEAVLDC